MDHMSKKTPPPVGVQADFILALARAYSALTDASRLSRALPEDEEYHRARSDLGVLLNRLMALETEARGWRD